MAPKKPSPKETSDSAQQGMASRQLAVEILVQVEQDQAYANLALSHAFKRKTLSERDRAFVTALVQGVIRHRSALDEKLKPLSKRPLDKLQPSLRNLLRMAVFQLDQMTDIPPSAVLNTSNELARNTGHDGLAKFANGVLRGYLRRDASQDAKPENDVHSLSVQYSMPDWLVERWLKTWGLPETIELLKYSQSIPELVVRTCEVSITPEGLNQVFTQKGIACTPGTMVDSCLIVNDRGKYKGPVEKLPGYNEGLFTVQDEAAALVSKVVAPLPGELVIDLCAAPGGKSLHLAELMDNKGRIIAVDSKAERLNLLRKNRQRLGLTNIEIMESDGRSFSADALADKVLVDAPCMGTGVMNKRSDLRFNRQAPDLDQLVNLQRELLNNAAHIIKPGGILVYSTCSIEPEENIENFEWFLKQHPNFAAESLRPYISAELIAQWQSADPQWNPDNGWLQLLPSRHQQSGFFIARSKKLNEVH